MLYVLDVSESKKDAIIKTSGKGEISKTKSESQFCLLKNITIYNKKKIYQSLSRSTSRVSVLKYVVFDPIIALEHISLSVRYT